MSRRKKDVIYCSYHCKTAATPDVLTKKLTLLCVWTSSFGSSNPPKVLASAGEGVREAKNDCNSGFNYVLLLNDGEQESV